MGHWKRVIKISGDTDCYYCINDMTRHDLPATCLVVLVTVPDHLSAIMLHVYIDTVLVSCYNSCSDLLLIAHVYFVTLPGTCYLVCSGILCMFCIAYIFYCCRHMPIRMVTSITSPLHVHVYHVTTRQSYLLYYNNWIRL